MTAEDELQQLSGSGHLNMLALRRTSSWTSAPPSCMSLDAWLAASGTTWEVVWHRFDLPAGRRPWLGCLRSLQYIESHTWCAVEHGVTVVQPGTDNTARYCLSCRRLAQYAHDAGRMYGSCTPSLPPWRDSRIAGASQSLRRVTSALAQPAACCRRPRLRGY